MSRCEWWTRKTDHLRWGWIATLASNGFPSPASTLTLNLLGSKTSGTKRYKRVLPSPILALAVSRMASPSETVKVTSPTTDSASTTSRKTCERPPSSVLRKRGRPATLTEKSRTSRSTAEGPRIISSLALRVRRSSPEGRLRGIVLLFQRFSTLRPLRPSLVSTSPCQLLVFAPGRSLWTSRYVSRCASLRASPKLNRVAFRLPGTYSTNVVDPPDSFGARSPLLVGVKLELYKVAVGVPHVQGFT